MKANLIYPFAFSLSIGVYFTLLSFQKSPESNLLGEWREVSWEYEKIDSLSRKGESFDYMLTDHIKDQISHNLIIHKAETWKFATDETLEMQGEQTKKSLHWTLKGRGNILQLNGDSDTVEHYQIQELTANKMVLYFNFDMQVRGIVKMTFEKVNA